MLAFSASCFISESSVRRQSVGFVCLNPGQLPSESVFESVCECVCESVRGRVGVSFKGRVRSGANSRAG